MKFRVTMKDPDGPYDCIKDAAAESLKAIGGLSDDEREALIEKRRETLSVFADRFMEYGEYITVEFDTEAGTATVVPRAKS